MPCAIGGGVDSITLVQVITCNVKRDVYAREKRPIIDPLSRHSLPCVIDGGVDSIMLVQGIFVV